MLEISSCTFHLGTFLYPGGEIRRDAQLNVFISHASDILNSLSEKLLLSSRPFEVQKCPPRK